MVDFLQMKILKNSNFHVQLPQLRSVSSKNLLTVATSSPVSFRPWGLEEVV